jgi:hypothetical protein
MTAALPFLAAAGSIIQGIQGAGQAQAEAKYYKQEAKAKQISGDFEAEKQRERDRRYTASQRAAFGASGVTMSGTPMDVIGQTLEEQEKDILALRYGTQLGINESRAKSAIARKQVASRLIGGFTNAAGGYMGSKGLG